MNGIFKRLKENNKGAAMAVALLVVMVLSLLGVALWQYFMIDTDHTAKDERGMQAYYIARAGADAVAQYIVKNPDGFDDTEMDNFITNLNTAPESDQVAFGKGIFSVKFTKNSDGNYEVRSKGVVKDATKNILLTMKRIGAPATPDDALSAAEKELKWLNGSSHVLNKHEDDIRPEPVSFFAGNPQDIMKDTTNGNSIFAALGLYFEQPVQIDNRCKVTLISNLIVFRGRVILDEKSGKTTGQLVLNVNELDPDNIIDASTIEGSDPNKDYGRVYFMQGAGDISGGQVAIGAYYFPDGCMLPCYENGVEVTGWTYEDAGLIPFSMISGYELIWN